MSLIRRLILSLVLMAGITPVLAQPAPVPALPDTERRTSYSISGTTCACAVNFQLYGDSTDYQNWIEVFLNGVRVNFNDATFGWTVTSPSGPLSSLARPITNAVLTFNSVQTGTVQIVGARKPRRTVQFTEGGVTARNLNVAVTDITATLREMWDKNNDITGRGLFSQPGNTMGPLPLPAACANGFLGFDATGLNPQCLAAGAGSGNVVGPVSSVNNDLACWNGTSGTLIKDCGGPTGTSGHAVPFLDGTNIASGANVFTGTVAVGTNAALPAGSAFVVNKNAAALRLQSFAGETWMARFAGVDGTAPVVSVESFGSFPFFACQRADGTGASPSAVQSGELLCALTAHAYGTTGFFGGSGQIRFEASQTWSDTVQGTRASIWTTANGSLASAVGPVIQFENDKGVTIPPAVTGGSKGAGTLNISGDYYKNGTIIPETVAAPITLSVGGQVGCATCITGSAGQIPGTATNDNASAGNVGEFPSSDIVLGSAVALTSGAPANITSISLTAGDWEVSATCGFTGGATTTVTALNCSMSTTSATLDTSDGRICSQGYNAFTLFNNINVRMPCGPARFTVASGTTTVFLVDQTAHAVSTASGFGLLRARRAR